MQNTKPLYVLFLLLLLAACSKETQQLNPTEERSFTQIELEKAEATIAALEQEIIATETVDPRGPTVVVPAGSHNALADAIDQAKTNGKVILAAGLHTESATVIIEKPVRIVGQVGAVLQVQNSGPSLTLDPAIYVRNAERVHIEGLEIRPMSGHGNTGILAYNAPRLWLKNNKIIDFYNGTYLQGAEQARILDNLFDGFGNMEGNWGLTVSTGKGVYVRGNEARDYFAGIFPSDKRGVAIQNKLHDNFLGMIICTAGVFTLPNGSVATAAEPGNQWLIYNNNAYNNAWGYVTIDGAFNNFLYQNRATNNSVYDIEMAGDSERFAPFLPFVPTSHDNTTISVGNLSNISIKVCGVNNKAIGGNLVDTDADPCF